MAGDLSPLLRPAASRASSSAWTSLTNYLYSMCYRIPCAVFPAPRMAPELPGPLLTQARQARPLRPPASPWSAPLEARALPSAALHLWRARPGQESRDRG